MSSNEESDGFHARLLEVIGDRSRAEFAREAGISAAGLQRLVNGGEPGLKLLRAIARAGGVSIQWLVEGDGSQSRSEVGNEFALVPRHEVRASAGHGLVPVEEGAVADLIAFRRDWLGRLGINPDNAALIEVSGDSMEPTIPDGAVILLDLAIDEVRNGRIYAIVRDGELMVKRVQKRLDGKVLLLSDNDRYEVEEVDEATLDQLHVVGRVRWVGRSF